jgi:hypothetical protein
MYFDNLTIAGVLVASAYGLLPLLFGREFWRVAEDCADIAQPPASAPATVQTSRRSNEIPHTAPCA